MHCICGAESMQDTDTLNMELTDEETLTARIDQHCKGLGQLNSKLTDEGTTRIQKHTYVSDDYSI